MKRHTRPVVHHRRWGMPLGGGAVLSGLLLAGAVLVPVRAGAQDEEYKVTICHRTNSVTNPYTVNSVDISSIDGSLGTGENDHTHHYGLVFDFAADPDVAYPEPRNGDQWGDIIPPYEFGDPVQTFPGMNWTEAGEAIWEAGCVNPAPTTTESTTTTEAAKVTEPSIAPTSEATVAVTTAVPAEPTQVLGITVGRNALAYTGAGVALLAGFGLVLVAVGLVIMVRARQRTRS